MSDTWDEDPDYARPCIVVSAATFQKLWDDIFPTTRRLAREDFGAIGVETLWNGWDRRWWVLGAQSMPTIYESISDVHKQVEDLMKQEQDAHRGAHSELYYDLANAEMWLHAAMERLRKRGDV